MPATQATTVKQFGTKSSFVIHWIDFYPVDSTIQPLNNRGLVIAPVHNTKKLPTFPVHGCLILLHFYDHGSFTGTSYLTCLQYCG